MPDRAPMRHRPRPDAHQGRARRRTAATRITGTKIFISAGEHDLTENIIHLVLARLPDAPKGIKGIRLFLVPKFLPRRGWRGRAERTASLCAGIEHKMGHHGVCHLRDEFRRRDRLAGRRAASGHAGHVHDDERRPARGRHPGPRRRRGRLSERRRLRPRAPAGPRASRRQAARQAGRSDPRPSRRAAHAADHARDTEGARALAYWIGMAIDRAATHPGPGGAPGGRRPGGADDPDHQGLLHRSGLRACANLGVQVYGGHGYIREYGMEQLVRDARITQIYEGANGIQALDLVGRKLPLPTGPPAAPLLPPGGGLHRGAPGRAARSRNSSSRWPRPSPACSSSRSTIAQQGLKNPDEAGAAASDYLRLFALVALAYMWTRMAQVAQTKLAQGADGDTSFYEAKLRDRALLHDQAPARNQRPLRPNHVRRGARHGVRGRRLLAMLLLSSSSGPSQPPPLAVAREAEHVVR